MSIQRTTLDNFILQLRFTMPEVMLIIGINLFVIVASLLPKSREIITGFTSVTDVIANGFDDILGSFTSIVDGSSGLSAFALALFWAALGSLVYVIVWVITSISSDTKQEVAIAIRYKHPRSFSQKKYWSYVIAEKIYYISLIMVLVFYGVFWVNVIMSWVVSRYTNVLTTNFNVLELVFALIVSVVTIHIWIVIVRLLLHRPHRSIT